MKKLTLLIAILLATTTFAQVPNYVPTNGLVGWWPFNGNANDESGNGNNGTIYGATLISDRNGVANSAFSFDGLNDYIQIPSNTNFINSEISISFNFKSAFTQEIQFLVLGNNNHTNWSISTTNSNLISFSKNQFCNNYVQNLFNTIINVNNWNNITITTNNSISKLFVNGINVDTLVSSNFNSNCSLSDLYLGFDILVNPEFFNGALDDIGIWNRALTDLEIATLFEGCNLSITSQPQDQNVPTSIGTANFSVSSSNSNATYQWQTNLGLGFQNLSNAGQYSGVTSSTLNISNLSMTNNNQVFRCLINDGGCTDTSTIATLTIIDDASISETGFPLLSISPNPTTGAFIIAGLELYNTISTMRVSDVNGKLVKELDPSASKFNLETVKSGIYFLTITAGDKQEVIKIIKE
jgi:hypothetical protein